MYAKYDEDGLVICQECGQAFRILNDNHMKKFHNMSLAEYHNKYPGFPISKLKIEELRASEEFVHVIVTNKEGKVTSASARVRDFITDKAKEYIREELGIAPSRGSVIASSNESSVDIHMTQPIGGTLTIEEIREQVRKEFMEEMESIELSKHKDTNYNISPIQYDTKEEIYLYLKKYYPDIECDKTIVDKALGGDINFQYVTDMTIPSRQIDIEFSKVFWHNDIYAINPESRKKHLRSIGWKILEINTISPTCQEVHNRVKKFIQNFC